MVNVSKANRAENVKYVTVEAAKFNARKSAVTSERIAKEKQYRVNVVLNTNTVPQ